MKSCPTCNRTFEDTFSFCLMDGSVLSAPYDPELKKEGRPAREPAPPRTEVMRTPEPQVLPDTQAASEPVDSLSTITSSSPIAPLDAPISPLQNSADDRSKQQLGAWLWVIVVLVAVGAIILVLKSI